jgi:multidrug efflux pump subunit AcrA (membrane-fusion protein)
VDVQRAPKRRTLRRVLSLGLLGLSFVALAVWLAWREPRPPAVERAAIWTGKVERGAFVLRVRGAGVLRPESIRWLTSESSGRVEEVRVEPGAPVEPDTVVVRLENLDLRLLAVQAARETQAVEAEILALERQTQRERLDLSAELAELGASLSFARRRADAYSEMQGTVLPRLEGEEMGERARELEQREALAQRRLGLLERLAPRQLGGLEQQAREVRRVQAVRQELVERLTVRASAHGILQDVLVELGQWVVPGTVVAKVIVSRKLQAELAIPAEQAGAISVGQAAWIRTGPGDGARAPIPGRVRRVAPAAFEGNVHVEVAFDTELPDAVRPDQSVDGTIELERIEDTLHLARPLDLALGSSSSLFRIDASTGVARRVPVRTGRVSIDSVEVLGGLEPGDEVILSDMSRYAQVDRVRVE